MGRTRSGERWERGGLGGKRVWESEAQVDGDLRWEQ